MRIYKTCEYDTNKKWCEECPNFEKCIQEVLTESNSEQVDKQK